MRLIFPFSATRFATQMSEMHLGSKEYEKWSIFNFLLPKCQTGKWIKNTETCFLNYLVTLVVRNMKAWPICCFLLLGGHNEKWMDQQYTDPCCIQKRTVFRSLWEKEAEEDKAGHVQEPCSIFTYLYLNSWLVLHDIAFFTIDISSLWFVRYY